MTEVLVPVCRPVGALETSLQATVEPALRCTQCRGAHGRSDTIWRFFPDDQLARYAQFLPENHFIRHDQGWGKAEVGHHVAAVDLSIDLTAGLGGHRWYVHDRLTELTKLPAIMGMRQ